MSHRVQFHTLLLRSGCNYVFTHFSCYFIPFKTDHNGSVCMSTVPVVNSFKCLCVINMPLMISTASHPWYEMLSGGKENHSQPSAIFQCDPEMNLSPLTLNIPFCPEQHDWSKPVWHIRGTAGHTEVRYWENPSAISPSYPTNHCNQFLHVLHPQEVLQQCTLSK